MLNSKGGCVLMNNYDDYRIPEEPKLMYFYKLKKSDDIVIEETAIKMEKWCHPDRLHNNPDNNIYYYKPSAGQSLSVNVPPVEVSEIGSMYHGMKMILEVPNKNHYIQELIKTYINKIDVAKNNIDRYESYIDYLENYTE